MDLKYAEKAEHFTKELPYKKTPYASRNWGNTWHSICSYHGKLKPAIAHLLVALFTEPGDTVLDPLCGVGTIPFEACLQGRIGIGNDLSEMAYVVSKAKLEKPSYESAISVISSLELYISENRGKYQGDRYKNFGLNGKLPEYFETNTYEEILIAREYFLNLFCKITPAEALVYAALLHILHGNRPYALSRRSHPLTPYAPTGEYEYKNLIKKLTAKVELIFKRADLDDYQPGKAILGDYSLLPSLGIIADSIICSPPFAESIRFYTANWMRLWMCGWELADFKLARTRFLDGRQKRGLSVYHSFFEMCNSVLKSNGRMILHLGKTKTIDMAKELSIGASPWFEVVHSADEQVINVEKHGIKDKGGTIAHQFLFLQKKS